MAGRRPWSAEGGDARRRRAGAMSASMGQIYSQPMARSPSALHGSAPTAAQPSPPTATTRKRPASARDRRVRREWLSNENGLDVERRVLSGRVDYSRASATMLHASARSTLLNSAASRDWFDMSHRADSYQLHEDLRSRWRQKLPEDLAWEDDRGVQRVRPDRVQLPTQSFAQFKAPASNHRAPSAASIATRISSGSADRRPSAADSDLVQIHEEHWTSNDEEEGLVATPQQGGCSHDARGGAMAPTPGRAGAYKGSGPGMQRNEAGIGGGEEISPVQIRRREEGSEAHRIEHLTERLVERESLVVALQRKLREHDGLDFGGAGQSTLRLLTKNLDKRRGQIAKLVLDQEMSRTECDSQLQDLENEIEHVRTRCDAEQARAARAEAKVDALSQKILSIEGAYQGFVTMQQQVECILRDLRLLQSELASGLAAQQRHIQAEAQGAGGGDDVAKRLNTRAQAGYLILGARNERAQSAQETATQRLAEQTIMTENAQTEVHRLTGVISHLKQQLSERSPHAHVTRINHEQRRSALVKLKQLEGDSRDCAAEEKQKENGRSAAVSSRREGSDGADGGKNPGDDSGAGESKTKSGDNGVTELLVEVQDDFLFTQLIHARAQVQALTQECTELRAQQILEGMPAAAQPKSNGDTSTGHLTEKLVALSEELHDTKIALKEAESQAAFMKSDFQDAEERCRRATHEAQLAKSNSLKKLLPSGTETELRAQIMDLTSVRERLDSRIKMLESQNSDAKTSHKSLHQMLLAERKLHHNTALIKSLRDQVEILKVRVKGAEADPLQLLVGYNGMISEDSERSLSSRTATVESEKCIRYSDLRKTAESFQTQLHFHLKELYDQKAETATWKNQKFALEKELLACREHLATVQKTVNLLEGNAEARANEIRPLLRAARLELVRSSFDLANLNCKRQPETAFDMWERGLSILEEIQEGKVANWTVGGDDMAFWNLEPTEIASVHHKMGMLLVEKKDMLAATDFFHKAFEVRVEQLGDEHIQTKKSHMWLRRCTADREKNSDDSDALDEADVFGAEALSPLAHRQLSPTVSFGSSNASSPDPERSLANSRTSGSFHRRPVDSHATSTKSLDLGSELGLHVITGPGEISSVGEAERAFASALKMPRARGNKYHGQIDRFVGSPKHSTV